ncbi:MAG: cytochrome c [Alphaproteobacteria bacterium]
MSIIERLGLAALAAGAVLAAGALGGPAQADDAKNVIAYRQNVMKGIAAHITQIAMVAKGEVSFTDQVAGNARAIAGAAGGIPAVFPEGSGEAPGAETAAQPAIWQQWDKFTASAQALQTEATKLAEIAEGGGDAAAIGAQLGELGKTCGGCHEPFRKKTD